MKKTSRRDLKAAKKDLLSRKIESALSAHFTAPRKSLRASIADLAKTPLNIIGVGLGEKSSSGRDTGDDAVVVLVQSKMPKGELPKRLRIPNSIDGIPTDVLEVGVVRALQGQDSKQTCLANPRQRQPRPVAAGVSIGVKHASAGTFGYVVRFPRKSERYILSNYHVLANLDDPSAKPEIFQPGKADGQLKPADKLGVLADGVEINFEDSPNQMDAAIAELDPNVATPFLCAIGPIQGTARVLKDDIVYAFGKTTAFMKGLVVQDSLDFVVRYPGNRRAKFVDQIAIRAANSGKPFARRGDSGALMVNHERLACGLIFAAGPTIGFATPITRVLNKFGVALAKS